jgi:ribonuclease HII
MHLAGIDEAGFGPLIGPLSVLGVAVEATDEPVVRREFAAAATGARDSKQVHTAGDISGIEAVALPALAWLLGEQPRTACACFSAVGESVASRAHFPWLAQAAEVALPIGPAVTPWRIRQVRPVGVSARIIQVPEYNTTLQRGLNKADLELLAVGGILRDLTAAGSDGEIHVDRLGGRRYYRDFLQEQWPQAMVLVEREEERLSCYQIVGSPMQQRVSFCVDGESHSILTAVASCIAKYLRELHMLLLNRFFCAEQPQLLPTAGYVQDARRWLVELGPSTLARHRNLLVRNGMEGKPRETTAPTVVPVRTETVKNAPLAIRRRSG